ncbi:galactose-1-phosphate uridylyltransferase [bacterium]|nr:galactose-1-phosphate uridylyltransferase [bacterium]
MSRKRWNPLLREWVIMAPATGVRPWSGALVEPVRNELPGYDPECYLCPGVERAGGKKNPDYTGVYVFDNDFPSLSMDYRLPGDGTAMGDEQPARGICRVVCFSPRHNLTLPEMEEAEVHGVFRTLRSQFAELSVTPGIEHVMIFENRGIAIGVSNPHPHGQIYSTDFVPKIPAIRYEQASKHMSEKGSCLFCSIIENEIDDGSRIVTENEHFAAFVPYFARLTFEIILIPRRHVPFITELTGEELLSLARIHREILIRYDNLFRMPFPNITVFQNCPCAGNHDPKPYHFHIEFLPPLRSRDKLKYMAGFESGGGNIINPSLPEESAGVLRELSTIHYTKRS